MKNEILLSTGSLPWMGIKRITQLVQELGYEGIEILPTRNIATTIQKKVKHHGIKKLRETIPELQFIKSIHQTWRLDIGKDKKYGIGFSQAMAYNLLRLAFFPNKKEATLCIKNILSVTQCPVIVHDITDEWTHDNQKQEFAHGIFYEIIGSKNPKDIQDWLTKKKHHIVIDTRDDQSLIWAKTNGFSHWKTFWTWLGITHIGGLQLTLIGKTGMNKIFQHQPSLAEDQLLWLQKQKWKGSVTVEVNPLSLFFATRGNIKKGLKEIRLFVHTTLREGKKWSS